MRWKICGGGKGGGSDRTDFYERGSFDLAAVLRKIREAGGFITFFVFSQLVFIYVYTYLNMYMLRSNMQAAVQLLKATNRGMYVCVYVHFARVRSPS